MKQPATRHSITFRMTFAVSAFLLIAQFVLAASAFYFFKQDAKATISQEQTTLLTVIAGEIDQKLLFAQRTIIATSKLITPVVVANVDLAQTTLDGRLEALELFDNGLFLFSPDGKLLNESPFLPNRRGRDISFRQYFKETVATGKPVISTPYPSTHTPGVPAVMFTAPVFDDEEKLIAIIGGSLNLLNDNFLGKISQATFAQSGYLYLFTHDRLLIMHPDKSRIMQLAAEAGVNLLLDRSLEGFEGTEENINSRGLKALTSFKHLKSVNWIMGANYPVAEAYQPIYQMQKYYFWGILFGSIVIIFVVRWMMASFTKPLVEFSQHVKDLSSKEGEDRLFTHYSKDEVGILTRTFNSMIQDEDEKSAALLHVSTHDALTGLYNRAYFDSELARLSHSRLVPISVVVADIDNLKECNDTQGHAAGDEMIKSAANVLLEAFRAEDIVARIGGDEFAVILPGVDEEQMALTMNRVRRIEAKTLGICELSISLGMATTATAGGLLDAFRKADQLMYQDKAVRKAQSHIRWKKP